MTNPVIGDALTALVERMRAASRNPDDRGAGSVWDWRVEHWADELEALIAAGRSAATPALRCDVTYANWNQCVRPHGHSEPHLTDNGFNWMPTSAPAPLPAPTAADEPR